MTFTPASLDRDTLELNNAITRGYEINDYIRTETGIVYILTKWSNQDISKNQEDKQNSSCGDLP
ncbi:MAG: hypothetical protein MAG458_01351 [Nitrosopumilus sp.]|nr:hypothetical protein [Nitrosopumilus sp.]